MCSNPYSLSTVYVGNQISGLLERIDFVLGLLGSQNSNSNIDSFLPGSNFELEIHRLKVLLVASLR